MKVLFYMVMFREGLPSEEIFEQRLIGSESFQAPRRASWEDGAQWVFMGCFKKSKKSWVAEAECIRGQETADEVTEKQGLGHEGPRKGLSFTLISGCFQLASFLKQRFPDFAVYLPK